MKISIWPPWKHDELLVAASLLVELWSCGTVESFESDLNKFNDYPIRRAEASATNDSTGSEANRSTSRSEPFNEQKRTVQRAEANRSTSRSETAATNKRTKRTKKK